MDKSKLAIVGFGFSAGVILVVTLIPTPKEKVAAAAVPTVTASVAKAPTPAGISDVKGEKPADSSWITEASVKKAVRLAVKGSTKFGKVYQGNGRSGRFSICGEVSYAKSNTTPFLYLADTGEVMLFTNPANERVTLEGYNIFMNDCRG